jgi:hypothetical protein
MASRKHFWTEPSGANVRFGSKADLMARKSDFRFTSGSGHPAVGLASPKIAKSGSGTSISHVSGACEDRPAPGSVDTPGHLKPSALWLAVLSFRVCQTLGRERAGRPTER